MRKLTNSRQIKGIGKYKSLVHDLDSIKLELDKKYREKTAIRKMALAKQEEINQYLTEQERLKKENRR